MTQTTDPDRAEFEAVASDNGKWPQAVERDAKGNYLLLTTANGWMWWQAARRAPAVPQGWKLVPVEPTSEMIDAANESDCEYSRRAFNGQMHIPQSGEDHWHAMIAAAPQPPEATVNHSLTVDSKEAAPVQLPEPVGVAHTGQLDNIKDGYAYVYPVGSVGAGCKLYTEQQVRQILSTLQK